jgi:hypothetical protein
VAECRKKRPLSAFAAKAISRFGGLRRFNVIGRELEENATYLLSGGWGATQSTLERLRKQPGVSRERDAARFLAEQSVASVLSNRETYFEDSG